MEHGYQLETSSLEGVVLRRLKGNEVVRTASANMSTVKVLEERGLIQPAKSTDPLQPSQAMPGTSGINNS
jgi:hypothetical protein